MTFFKPILTTVALGVLLTGCGANIQNKEAVQKGIVEYFQKNKESIGLNLDQMTIDVMEVSYKGKEAIATVAFRIKNSAVNTAAMQMKYTLEEKSGKWVVKGKSGADAHAPGAGGDAPPTGVLPPNHPPTTQQKN